MRIGEWCRSAVTALGTLFYPPHCVQCVVPTEPGVYLCAGCARRAPRIERPFCRVCSQPFEGEIGGTFTCINCHDRRFHFECAVSPYKSRDVVRELIHRFKYQRQYYLRHPLAAWLVEAWQDERLTSGRCDALVPVPLHPVRRREREFNQAEVLSQMAGRRLGIPMLACLQRIRNTRTQTQFDRQTRMENLRNAFRLRKNAAVQGKDLVIIDDVLTTGSTVDECARILRAAGAASVRVVTVARG